MGLLVGLIFPFLISDFLGGNENNRAKSFCEKLVPDLDMEKSKTGKYPADIFVIVKRDELPSSLKGYSSYFYYSDGNSFNFRIDGETFSSEERVWKQWD